MNRIASVERIDDRGARVVLAVEGPDAERFLQGLLSADVARATERAVPAALLDVKGRLVSEVVVIRRGEGFLLVLPAEVADDVHAFLDRHVVMDDVRLTREELRVAWAWPEAPAATPGLIVAPCEHPPGALLLGSAASIAAQETRAPDDAEAWARHRVDSGTPAWGHELRPGRLPPELGYAYAIAYDKGCFLGQEPLARLHARGQVHRVLVRVRADPGSTVGPLRAPEREDAGTLTSLAGALGLAIVHRSCAQPGTRLQDEAGREIEVTTAALGDDPGAAPARG
jgi:hypothetical protein